MPKNGDRLRKHSPRPIITVVIPCHNHADMLGFAIDSVVCQEYRPLQIIVVDDGSSDNPEKVVEEKSDCDVSIKILRNEIAKGPSASRNMAIQEGWDETDAFMMLDADDLYLSGKISKSVEKFLEDPKTIGIVYSDAIIRNIKTKTEIYEFRKPFSREALEMECIISNTPLVSKFALSKSGGYDETMRTCEDWDLWLRITESSVAVHIPEALHVYHVTGKNSSDIVSKDVWNENWAKIADRIKQRRSQ